MAVATYIVNTRDATEVCVDNKSTKEIAIVNYRYPGALPIKIVGSHVPGVQAVRIVGSRYIVINETFDVIITPVTPPVSTSFLLLETGDRILLETGDKILLES